MAMCHHHVPNRPLTILGFLAAMIVISSSARAAIINVPADFATIQAAIADAGTVNGDEIVVAPGTYLEAINFLGKAITVRSSGGAAVTTIDGTGNFHVVQGVNGETSTTVLDGFTITGGNANGVFPDVVGAESDPASTPPVLALVTIAMLPAMGSAGVINVPGDFGTIQAAIDAAVDTDEISAACFFLLRNPQGDVIAGLRSDQHQRIPPAGAARRAVGPAGPNMNREEIRA